MTRPSIRAKISHLSPPPVPIGPGYRMARMTSLPAIPRTALSGKEWRVLILLLLSALINYIDRTTLSVAATDIQRELHLTNTQVGALQSAFFASYALCQLSFLAGRRRCGYHFGLGRLLRLGGFRLARFLRGHGRF